MTKTTVTWSFEWRDDDSLFDSRSPVLLSCFSCISFTDYFLLGSAGISAGIALTRHYDCVHSFTELSFNWKNSPGDHRSIEQRQRTNLTKSHLLSEVCTLDALEREEAMKEEIFKPLLRPLVSGFYYIIFLYITWQKGCERHGRGIPKRHPLDEILEEEHEDRHVCT